MTEFATYFRDFQDCYCVIGGTATLVYLDERIGQHTKTTKDLDVVILDISLAGRSNDFLMHFRDYIAQNNYETVQLASGKSQSYRFSNPKNRLAPSIIEIATRRKEGIPLDRHAQKIEEFDLSAIVCEDAYLEIVKEHREMIYWMGPSFFPIPVAKIVPLIVMKAFAFERLIGIDKNKANKHLNDILRLCLALREGDAIALNHSVLAPVERLLSRANEFFDSNRLKSCGWTRKTKPEEVVAIIKEFLREHGQIT